VLRRGENILSNSNAFETRSAEEAEIAEWLESLDYVIDQGNLERVQRLLRELEDHAHRRGVGLPFVANTPYVNTIPVSEQPAYPGDLEIEGRIRSVIRWNAMAMVVRANRHTDGIGGHISTYASCATLLEVGFNHIFRGKSGDIPADQIFFQGHAAPGIYARAFLEGRLTHAQLDNFRRELAKEGGLSSYPHPWLMPDFWEFPTVSMGLGPIMAIYQARFNKYLQDRGLESKTGRVFCFLGDGEVDEPEALGSISVAGREKLDNLVFIINCNLQRLDGPVRGNGKIIQELEAMFRGAGWNVIKVIWGGRWDRLLEHDEEGALTRRMMDAVDGEYQNYKAHGGAYTREHFFGVDPRLREMVADMSDEEIFALNRGGHDPEKVYAAYRAAEEYTQGPTVILAKTIKGYGLGEAGEGRNVTHQQKKLNEEELLQFRKRFKIPVSDKVVDNLSFYRPPSSSLEIKYLRERREKLGGFVPERRVEAKPPDMLPSELFQEFVGGSNGREASTTMVIVRMLAKLLADPGLGARIVPIIPDEGRTFGMEALFRKVGIYSHVGQRYTPVDRETLLYYREATDGQILEEGITEAGAMSSFLAAGTSYATHGIPTIPFYLYYSMFGLQRIGDLVWAAGDMRCRGFLVGATAGRTTLAGEGLQHQDGNSHVLALPYPHVRAYDPAFAYELAVIVETGMRRMFFEGEDCLYYLTVGNEPYAMPPMPEGVEEGIRRGMYRFKAASRADTARRVRLFGSGAILNEALQAQAMLEERFGVAAEVWSVTSYKQLYDDGMACDRWNRLHPQEPSRMTYVAECLGEDESPVVAATDYCRALPLSIARWVKSPFVALGTDGFGRSESRDRLRDFFEVDARHIAVAALSVLARGLRLGADEVEDAIRELGINRERMDPWRI